MKALVGSIGQESPLQAALKVKERLDSCGVGYGADRRFTSLVSPQPFLISTADRDIIERRGQAIRDWVAVTNQLYLSSLTDKKLGWLRDLLETGLEGEALTIHRRLFTTKPMRVPLFMRMDQPSVDKAVEAQTPGSGWGYHAALATCYEDYDLLGRTYVESVANQLRILTGRKRPRVVHLLHKADFYGSEADFFAQTIRKLGIDFTISVRKIPEDIADYDVVLRHYIEELTQYDGWQELLQLYLDGRIEIEPTPSVITDHKVATM